MAAPYGEIGISAKRSTSIASRSCGPREQAVVTKIGWRLSHSPWQHGLHENDGSRTHAKLAVADVSGKNCVSRERDIKSAQYGEKAEAKQASKHQHP